MYDPNDSTPQFHTSGNTKLGLKMRASQQRIQQERREHRPKNMTNTYNSMQKELLSWRDKTFGVADPASHTANRSKVVYYIESERGEDPNATLSVNTIEIHLAAIVDLWRDQRNRGINSFPHPRIECEQFMDALAGKESKKKRDEYHDRATLTIGDGYTTVEELTA
ncbi:hypothetical protein [Parasitella parasitica]|uniref:Ndc10 domain-containing protein n=1 Tax=Parasitella parasitica TaxID=35722 RepID=A0A0B7NXY5_9FUNG|nr:hypothetical protein [Parasitella parasitica]